MTAGGPYMYSTVHLIDNHENNHDIYEPITAMHIFVHRESTKNA